MTENEMDGWHHRHKEYEFEQAPGDSEGQGSLECCSPRGRKDLDTTELRNNKASPKSASAAHPFLPMETTRKARLTPSASGPPWCFPRWSSCCPVAKHHSWKAPVLQRSAFFMVQLSHPYMTTGKTTALTTGNFAGKVMSLLFNMLSRLVIGFLPKSKSLLISWLLSPSSVILEGKKINSLTVSTVSLSICHEVMGPDAMILVF